jgi:hypothetical protein
MRARAASWLGLVAALAAIALGLCASGAPTAQGQTVGPSGDFAGRVEIAGGRQLYLECHGSG